jgi:hypothetical protein
MKPTFDLSAAASVATQTAPVALALREYPFGPVTTPEQDQTAIDVARQAAVRLKEVKAVEASALDPLMQVVNTIKGWFAPIRRDLESVIKDRKDASMAFAAANKAAAQAAIVAAARAEVSAEEVAAAVAVLAPVPKGRTSRQNWSFEITDVSAIPREYMIPDQKRLDALARTEKSKLSIPGGRPVNNPTAVLRR